MLKLDFISIAPHLSIFKARTNKKVNYYNPFVALKFLYNKKYIIKENKEKNLQEIIVKSDLECRQETKNGSYSEIKESI